MIASAVQRRAEYADTEQSLMTREREGFPRQLVQCDKEVKKWESAYIDDAITLEDCKAKKAEIAVRRASAQQELTRLDEQQRFLEHTTLEMTSLTAYCTRVRKNLRSFSMEEKHLALDALNITVIWYPDNPLEIRGSIPVGVEYSTSRCAASLARHRPTAQSRAGLWHG